MLVVHSPLCLLHNPPTEILSGKPVPYKESPDRLVRVRNALSSDPEAKFELVAVDDELDIFPNILAVHSADYIAYLRSAYDEWVQEGGDKVGLFPCTPKLYQLSVRQECFQSPFRTRSSRRTS